MSDNLSKMKAAMAGATKSYKANLRKHVDEATYRDIQSAASKIINTLPDGVPLGTLTAALMLAATAYAEAAPHATLLISQPDDGADDQSKAP